MAEPADDQNQDEGLFKRPVKGSFKRVGERMAKEVSEKSPTESVRDDLGGSSEPTDDEHEHLEGRVDEARGDHPRGGR